MDNSKVIVKETENLGKGLFAIEDIKKDEIIADWTNGISYEAESTNKLPNQLPKNIRDHAIQYEEHKWMDTEGIGRYSNHSCSPNCGFKGKFHLVAMRDIKKGEHLTWDYEMTEDSDWRLECKCGNSNCRKIIGAYQNMPEIIRKKYKGYISDWLIEKYK
ncbi:MAG: SET domain-containing protein-lysine N-methyltransferase [Nanoarchaeota archaeon]